MKEKHRSHPLAVEAANPDTPPGRLVELCRNRALVALVAANPATPAHILEKLADDGEAEVRRAVVLNSNTPVDTLFELAEEFPHEFLRNPVIPLLNLSQPDFIKSAPVNLWYQLLRCEDMPRLWLQWIENGIISFWEERKTELVGAARMHVAVAGEVSGEWTPEIAKALATYERRVTSKEEYSEHTVKFFLPFLLWLPPHMQNWLEQKYQPNGVTGGLMLRYLPHLSEATLTRLAKQWEQLSIVDEELAHHPHTPEHLLTRFAASKDRKVRKEVATNPQVSAALLHQLAGDTDPVVRRAVAHHHRTSRDDLRQLMSDPDVFVRQAVAVHKNLTEETCLPLVSDAEPQVRAALAGNPRLSKTVLTILAADAEPQVRTSVARNPRLPAELRAVLLQDTAIEVQAGLAGNPQTPPDILQQLAQHPSLSVQRALAGNARIPVDLLVPLAQSTDEETQKHVAGNPRTPAELLSQLARGGNVAVQVVVAGHKHTPLETLVWLAEQVEPDNYAFLSRLLVHPRLPLDVVRQLLFRSRDSFRLPVMLVNHPAVVCDKRRVIFDYFLAQLKKAVSGEKKYISFRLQLLRYQELPAPILGVLACSSFWQERYLVARHPMVTQNILNTLLHDGNRYVRAAAREELLKRL